MIVRGSQNLFKPMLTHLNKEKLKQTVKFSEFSSRNKDQNFRILTFLLMIYVIAFERCFLSVFPDPP